MEQNDTPHWSVSAFSCYLQCPMKYNFRYVEHAPVERTGVCLPFGRAYHAVLSERAVKGTDFVLTDAQESFAAHLKSETEASENLVYKQDETFDSCLQKGFDMLKVALENWQDDYAVKSVAESFSVTVPKLHYPIIGEFDMVVTDGKDEAIVDWKTASAKWPAGKADRELQASVYCYAYRQIYKLNPIFRYDVCTKTKQPTVSSWYTIRSNDELERLEWLVNRIERNVEAGVFYPNESVMNCGECPYRDRCKVEHRKWR